MTNANFARSETELSLLPSPTNLTRVGAAICSCSHCWRSIRSLAQHANRCIVAKITNPVIQCRAQIQIARREFAAAVGIAVIGNYINLRDRAGGSEAS